MSGRSKASIASSLDRCARSLRTIEASYRRLLPLMQGGSDREHPGARPPESSETLRSRQIREVLQRSNVLHHPCDLDLLLFFHRHPQSLLTSDQLAAFVGYGLPQIGKSLDALIAAAIIERSQNPTHYARMYRLVRGRPDDGIASIVKVATTRQGRRDVVRVLKEVFGSEGSGSAVSPGARAMPSGERKVAYA